MGENLTNELFKRADFPSINIGKTKTITAIAYALWKLEKRMPEYRKNKNLLNCTINEETYKNVFLIQMYLGLRIGETLALNINDIDIEKQIINVNKTLTLGKDNEVIIGDTTKTYASKRTIPIPDFLIPSIKEQLEIAKENKDNMLFLYNDHYISHSVANSRLKRILQSTLGMKAKDISTHSLRHTSFFYAKKFLMENSSPYPL